ncbi:hypothetical protein M885DRAFT_592325 [Pelagophyceae sp. CCMP2097]|nr:hypothetical protein M885DRAFT_592325 [Pelagophyceae sp. CCMP2097]
MECVRRALGCASSAASGDVSVVEAWAARWVARVLEAAQRYAVTKGWRGNLSVSVKAVHLGGHRAAFDLALRCPVRPSAPVSAPELVVAGSDLSYSAYISKQNRGYEPYGGAAAKLSRAQQRDRDEIKSAKEACASLHGVADYSAPRDGSGYEDELSEHWFTPEKDDTDKDEDDLDSADALAVPTALCSLRKRVDAALGAAPFDATVDASVDLVLLGLELRIGLTDVAATAPHGAPAAPTLGNLPIAPEKRSGTPYSDLTDI